MSSAPTVHPKKITRAKLREIVRGLLSYLIAIGMAFSPLTHAVMTSTMGPGNAGSIQMEYYAHHGDSMVAMDGTSLDSGGVPVHCNQFSDGASDVEG